MRKDSLIPSLLGIPPIQISRELLIVSSNHSLRCRETEFSGQRQKRAKQL